MSQIRSKNTKPEILVRQFLHASGFRFRLHAKELIGKPDIVLPKYKTLVFVNGCFWHSHAGCKYAVIPKTRTEWWTEKLNKNCTNDSKAIQELKELGWRIIIIWECMLKKNNIDFTLNQLKDHILLGR